jgi:hypothetical protein
VCALRIVCCGGTTVHCTAIHTVQSKVLNDTQRKIERADPASATVATAVGRSLVSKFQYTSVYTRPQDDPKL